jgi:outer membrane protein OmpA-like peptidoglycan-associated protein
MQRKANRLLLLLIGTALAACSSTSEQGSSGTETEPEIVPSTVQSPPPELEPVQYTEAELDVSDLGPIDYSDETVTYEEEVTTTVDSGISDPQDFPDEPLEFPVTTYELPDDFEEDVADLGAVETPTETLSYEEEVFDLGSVETSAETLTYAEENVPDTGPGVSAPQEFAEEEITELGPVETSGETMSFAEENLADSGPGVSDPEEFAMEEEIGELGPVAASDEVMSFSEEPLYQEESVGDVTTYQSVTVNAAAQPLFAFDKADVGMDEQYKLESFVSELADAEFETVWVVGHTDRIGTVEYNQGLSERRANAVKAFLVKLGIGGDMINTAGRSELMPVTSENECAGTRGNALIECFQPDRRVEVSVSAEVVREVLN